MELINESTSKKPGYRCTLENLSSLQDLRLTGLDISTTRVVDLTPVANHPLRVFNASHTDFRDVALLRKLPIQFFDGTSSKVDDLEMLREMPLLEIRMDDRILKANLPLLESLRAKLRKINRKPAEEFWRGVGK